MFLKIKCCPFSAKLALFIALLIKTVDIKSSTAASKIGLSDNQFEIEDNFKMGQMSTSLDCMTKSCFRFLTF